MADKPPNNIAEILEARVNREGPPSPVELETYYRAFPNILHNELAQVTSAYLTQFGHPPGDRAPTTKFGRAPQSEILRLAKDALETGEPVPGWAEAYEERQQMRKTNWGVVA